MKRETCKKCGQVRDGSHASYCRACYNAYKREWYEANREKEIQRAASYNKAHPEVPRAAMRRSRERRPEHFREYLQNYRKNNRDRVSVWDRNKTAKRRTAIVSSAGVKLADWRRIKANYRNCCAYCRKPSKRLQMDHIVPLSKGGKHEPDNIAPACPHCNNSKSARDELDFRQRIGQLL